MPEYTVPKFIEHKPKIVGPLTFQQFIFVGVAGAIGFFLYFTIHFYFFLLATIFLMLGAFALAFVKIGGRSLPTILKNFILFSFSPKIYLWKKKTLPPKIIEKPKPQKPMIEEKAPAPKVVEKSRLKDLSTHIETGVK